MKTFLIPEFGITVQIEGLGGAISSELKKHLIGDDPTPMALKPSCCEDEIDGAVDAIESLILGHAVAGIDVASPAYVEGLQSCVEAIGNHYS